MQCGYGVTELTVLSDSHCTCINGSRLANQFKQSTTIPSRCQLQSYYALAVNRKYSLNSEESIGCAIYCRVLLVCCRVLLCFAPLPARLLCYTCYIFWGN